MPQPTISHTEKKRLQYRANTLQIFWLCRITEQEFNQLLYDMCLEWLEHYTDADSALLEELMREPIIWQWWVCEWYMRDNTQYLKALYYVAPSARLARYKALHRQAFNQSTPPYNFLEYAYTNALNRLLHGQH